MLSNKPKHWPAAHPGQGKRAAPLTNPIPKRAMARPNHVLWHAFVSPSDKNFPSDHQTP